MECINDDAKISVMKMEEKLVHWANLWGRPQHWRMKGGMRHRSDQQSESATSVWIEEKHLADFN